TPSPCSSTPRCGRSSPTPSSGPPSGPDPGRRARPGAGRVVDSTVGSPIIGVEQHAPARKGGTDGPVSALLNPARPSAPTGPRPRDQTWRQGETQGMAWVPTDFAPGVRGWASMVPTPSSHRTQGVCTDAQAVPEPGRAG